jgi:hypothetical protein
MPAQTKMIFRIVLPGYLFFADQAGMKKDM